MSTDTIYEQASKHLTSLINHVWVSEEAMIAWTKTNAFFELDRTTRAFLLVGKMVDTALVQAGMNAGSIMPIDRLMTVLAMAPKLNDFNILSQFLLNLKSGTPGVDDAKMHSDLAAAEEKFKNSEDSPFAKKAKFKTGENITEYNAALALAKNYKILSGMQKGVNSYRVTPMGKTPALADLNNLSNLSLQSLLPYLKGPKLFLFDATAVLLHINAKETEDGIITDGLQYYIKSESGGDIVKKAIASRYLTWEVLKEKGVLNIVPRYESLLVTGTSEGLQKLLDAKLLVEYDGLEKRD